MSLITGSIPRMASSESGYCRIFGLYGETGVKSTGRIFFIRPTSVGPEDHNDLGSLFNLCCCSFESGCVSRMSHVSFSSMCTVGLTLSHQFRVIFFMPEALSSTHTPALL